MVDRKLVVSFGTEGYADVVRQLQQSARLYDEILAKSTQAAQEAAEAQRTAAELADPQKIAEAERQRVAAVKRSNRIIQASYRELKISSSDQIDQMRKQAIAAYNAIAQSGRASARDIEVAYAALHKRLGDLDDLFSGVTVSTGPGPQGRGGGAEAVVRAIKQLPGDIGDAVADSINPKQNPLEFLGGLLTLPFRAVSNVAKTLVTLPVDIAISTAKDVKRGYGEEIGRQLSKDNAAPFVKQKVDAYASQRAEPLGNFVAQKLGYKDGLNGVARDLRDLGDLLDGFIDVPRIQNKLDTFEDVLVSSLQKAFVFDEPEAALDEFREYFADTIESIRSIAFRGLGVATRIGAQPFRIRKRVEIARSAQKAQELADEIDLSDPEEERKVREAEYIAIHTGGINFDPKAGNTNYSKNVISQFLPGSHTVAVPNLYSQVPADTGIIGLINQLQKTFGGEEEDSLGFGGTPFGKLLEIPLDKGFNPDAQQIAAKALAYRKKFPEKPIELFSSSGGAGAIEEAIAILEHLGIKDVKATGVTFPLTGLTQTASTENLKSIVGDLDYLFHVIHGLSSLSPEERKKYQGQLEEAQIKDPSSPASLLLKIGNISGLIPVDKNKTSVIPGAGLNHSLIPFLSDPGTQEAITRRFGRRDKIAPEFDSTITSSKRVIANLNFISKIDEFNDDLESIRRTFGVLTLDKEARIQTAKGGQYAFFDPQNPDQRRDNDLRSARAQLNSKSTSGRVKEKADRYLSVYDEFIAELTSFYDNGATLTSGLVEKFSNLEKRFFEAYDDLLKPLGPLEDSIQQEKKKENTEKGRFRALATGGSEKLQELDNFLALSDEQKAIERGRRKYQKNLEKRSRFQEKQDFNEAQSSLTEIISEDIGTPLTLVSKTAKTAREAIVEFSDAVREFSDDAKMAAANLGALPANTLGKVEARVFEAFPALSEGKANIQNRLKETLDPILSLPAQVTNKATKALSSALDQLSAAEKEFLSQLPLGAGGLSKALLQAGAIGAGLPLLPGGAEALGAIDVASTQIAGQIAAQFPEVGASIIRSLIATFGDDALRTLGLDGIAIILAQLLQKGLKDTVNQTDKLLQATEEPRFALPAAETVRDATSGKTAAISGKTKQTFLDLRSVGNDLDQILEGPLSQVRATKNEDDLRQKIVAPVNQGGVTTAAEARLVARNLGIKASKYKSASKQKIGQLIFDEFGFTFDQIQEATIQAITESRGSSGEFDPKQFSYITTKLSEFSRRFTQSLNSFVKDGYSVTDDVMVALLSEIAKTYSQVQRLKKDPNFTAAQRQKLGGYESQLANQFSRFGKQGVQVRNILDAQFQQDLRDNFVNRDALSQNQIIQDAIAEAIESGKALTSGIAEGVAEGSGQSDVIDSMSRVVDEGIDAAKKAGEIQSPSRKSEREVGEPLGQGVAKGIENSSDSIDAAWEALLAEVRGTSSTFGSEIGQSIVQPVQEALAVVQDTAQNVVQTVQSTVGSIQSTVQETIQIVTEEVKPLQTKINEFQEAYPNPSTFNVKQRGFEFNPEYSFRHEFGEKSFQPNELSDSEFLSKFALLHAVPDLGTLVKILKEGFRSYDYGNYEKLGQDDVLFGTIQTRRPPYPEYPHLNYRYGGSYSPVSGEPLGHPIYGAVSLELDYSKLKNSSLFTVGDSLSIRQTNRAKEAALPLQDYRPSDFDITDIQKSALRDGFWNELILLGGAVKNLAEYISRIEIGLPNKIAVREGEDFSDESLAEIRKLVPQADIYDLRNNSVVQKGIGTNTVDALATEVKEGSSKAESAGQQLGDTLTQGTKDALEIASPSKVFIKIGENIVESLEIGVEDLRNLRAIVINALNFHDINISELGLNALLDDLNAAIRENDQRQEGEKHALSIPIDFYTDDNNFSDEFERLNDDLSDGLNDADKIASNLIFKLGEDVVEGFTLGIGNLPDFADIIIDFLNFNDIDLGDLGFYKLISDIRQAIETENSSPENRFEFQLDYYLDDKNFADGDPELIRDVQKNLNSELKKVDLELPEIKTPAIRNLIAEIRKNLVLLRSEFNKGGVNPGQVFAESIEGSGSQAAKAAQDVVDEVDAVIKNSLDILEEAWKDLGLGEALDKVQDEVGAFSKEFKPVDKLGQLFRNIFGGIADSYEKLENQFPSIKKLRELLVDVAQAALGLFGIFAIGNALVNFGQQAVETSIKMEALERTIITTSSSAEEGQQRISYLRDEIKRLGLDAVAATQFYARLNSAFSGTQLEGLTSRAFTSISEFLASRGANPEEQDRAYQALLQTFSKGRVQSEELRSQLAEIPATADILQISARALGKTVVQLSRDLEQGRVSSEEYAVAITSQLKAEANVGAYLKSNQALVNRVSTEWTLLTKTVGDYLLNAGRPFIDWAGKAISALTNNLVPILKVVTTTITLLISPLALRVLGFFINQIARAAIVLITLSVALVKGKIGLIGFFQAMTPFLGVAARFIAISIAIEAISKAFELSKNSAEEFAGATREAEEALRKLKKQQGQKVDDKNSKPKVPKKEGLAKITDGNFINNIILNIPKAFGDTVELIGGAIGSGFNSGVGLGGGGTVPRLPSKQQRIEIAKEQKEKPFEFKNLALEKKIRELNEEVNKLITTSKQAVSKANQELDRIPALRNLQLQLQKLRTEAINIPSGDKIAVEQNFKRQNKIVKQISDESAKVAGATSTLAAVQKSLQTQLDLLEERRKTSPEDVPNYDQIKARLQGQLNEVVAAQNKFKTAQNLISAALSALDLKLRDATESLAGFKEQIELRANRRTAQTINRGLLEGLSPNQIQESLVQGERVDRKSIAAELQSKISELYKYLNSGIVQQVFKTLGINLKTVSTQTLERLGQDVTLTPDQQTVVKTISEIKALEAELAQNQAETAQDALTLANQLFDFNKAILDYLRNLSRTLEDVRVQAIDNLDQLQDRLKDLTFEKLTKALETKIQETQNNIKRFALNQSNAFSATPLDGVRGNLNTVQSPFAGIFQSLQERLGRVNDFSKFGLDAQQQAEQTRRQIRDLNKSQLATQLSIYRQVIDLKLAQQDFLRNLVIPGGGKKAGIPKALPTNEKAQISIPALTNKGKITPNAGGPTNDAPNLYVGAIGNSKLNAIAEAANKLGVTIEDIATLIQVESSFRNIRGGSGRRYGGYFQLGAGALADVSNRYGHLETLDATQYSFEKQADLFTKYVLLRGYQPGSGIRPLYNTLNLGKPNIIGVDGFGTPGGRTSKLDPESQERVAARNVLRRLSEEVTALPPLLPQPPQPPQTNYSVQNGLTEFRGLFGDNRNVITLPNVNQATRDSVAIFGGVGKPSGQGGLNSIAPQRTPLPGEIGGLFGSSGNRIALEGGQVSPSFAQTVRAFGGIGQPPQTPNFAPQAEVPDFGFGKNDPLPVQLVNGQGLPVPSINGLGGIGGGDAPLPPPPSAQTAIPTAQAIPSVVLPPLPAYTPPSYQYTPPIPTSLTNPQLGPTGSNISFPVGDALINQIQSTGLSQLAESQKLVNQLTKGYQELDVEARKSAKAQAEALSLDLQTQSAQNIAEIQSKLVDADKQTQQYSDQLQELGQNIRNLETPAVTYSANLQQISKDSRDFNEQLDIEILGIRKTKIQLDEYLPRLQELIVAHQRQGQTDLAAQYQQEYDALVALNGELPKLLKIREIQRQQYNDFQRERAQQALREYTLQQSRFQLDREQSLQDIRSEIVSTQGGLLEQRGKPFASADLQQANAIAEENLRFRRQLQDIQEQAAKLGLAAEDVQRLTDAATQLNQVKLGAIREQFGTIRNTLRDISKNAFKSFFQDALSLQKGIKGVFESLVRSVADQLTQLASDLLSSQLTNVLFGKKQQPNQQGQGGLLGRFFSRGNIIPGSITQTGGVPQFLSQLLSFGTQLAGAFLGAPSFGFASGVTVNPFSGPVNTLPTGDFGFGITSGLQLFTGGSVNPTSTPQGEPVIYAQNYAGGGSVGDFSGLASVAGGLGGGLATAVAGGGGAGSILQALFPGLIGILLNLFLGRKKKPKQEDKKKPNFQNTFDTAIRTSDFLASGGRPKPRYPLHEAITRERKANGGKPVYLSALTKGEYVLTVPQAQNYLALERTLGPDPLSRLSSLHLAEGGDEFLRSQLSTPSPQFSNAPNTDNTSSGSDQQSAYTVSVNNYITTPNVDSFRRTEDQLGRRSAAQLLAHIRRG